MPTVAAFVVPYWQVPAGVDPHMLAAAFRTPEFDILQDLLVAGLPPPAVRLLWQSQVRQIIQKGIFHESGPNTPTWSVQRSTKPTRGQGLKATAGLCCYQTIGQPILRRCRSTLPKIADQSVKTLQQAVEPTIST